MLRYAKGKAPACLTGWQATRGATWDSLSAAEKGEIREALVRDQGMLCAYCQRRIAAEAPRMKIEHWDARSSGGAYFQWRNLLGVCLGNPALEGAPGDPERHCDDARGNKPLFLDPVEGPGPSPRSHLKYTGAGEVRAVGDDSRVQSDINILNLNAHRLRRARRDVLDQLRAKLDLKEFSTHQLTSEKEKHTIRHGEKIPEHAEVVLYYVNRWLRRR
jgi:uncharacterized protein (TIGR02646 family)